MLLNSYLFHLKALNLSPKTVKVAGEYISLFIRVCDPLTGTKRDIEEFLGSKSAINRPSAVQTYWSYLKQGYRHFNSKPTQQPIPQKDSVSEHVAATGDRLFQEVGRCRQNLQGGYKLHWIQIARREALLKNDSSVPIEGIGSDASTEVLAGCSCNRLQTGWRGFRNNHRYDDPMGADSRLALANEGTVGSTITETSLDMDDGTLFCYHRHSGNSTSKSLDVAPCCHDFLLWDSPDLGADLFV